MSSPEADLLKVAPGAGLDELKKAYRKAALAAHPDQNPHPEAARHFRRITEAFRVLEAHARLREPPAPPKELPLTERAVFLLGDLEALTRWPSARWNQSVDGLPAGVWVASVIDVLAAAWPEFPAEDSVSPSPEAVAQAVVLRREWLAAHPVPRTLPRAEAKALAAVMRAAETRIQALLRPTRR